MDADNLEPLGAIARNLAAALRSSRLYREAQEGRRLAEEASRLKSRFLSTVSHELRTPLNLIVGLSELLLHEGEEELPPALAADLERIYGSAQHLGRLINDVLDMASSDANQLRVLREPLDLSDTLRVVALAGAQLAQAKGLTWSLRTPASGPWVLGDRTRLRQVVLNLVSNAVKFTEHGAVELRVEVVGEDAVISVHDTGLGITPEEQGRLFREFSRADRVAAGGYGGLGLGSRSPSSWWPFTKERSPYARRAPKPAQPSPLHCPQSHPLRPCMSAPCPGRSLPYLSVRAGPIRSWPTSSHRVCLRSNGAPRRPAGVSSCSPCDPRRGSSTRSWRAPMPGSGSAPSSVCRRVPMPPCSSTASTPPAPAHSMPSIPNTSRSRWSALRAACTLGALVGCAGKSRRRAGRGRRPRHLRSARTSGPAGGRPPARSSRPPTDVRHSRSWLSRRLSWCSSIYDAGPGRLRRAGGDAGGRASARGACGSAHRPEPRFGRPGATEPWRGEHFEQGCVHRRRYSEPPRDGPYRASGREHSDPTDRPPGHRPDPHALRGAAHARADRRCRGREPEPPQRLLPPGAAAGSNYLPDSLPGDAGPNPASDGRSEHHRGCPRRRVQG
ncbi:hypothetical protein HC891_21185 [Candidatus Gracilibacteria bacterium]|nr:hypothetical protein [Candidatus Gracilibacteria bacterium]